MENYYLVIISNFNSFEAKPISNWQFFLKIMSIASQMVYIVFQKVFLQYFMWKTKNVPKWEHRSTRRRILLSLFFL